jgi:hypothetical protein
LADRGAVDLLDRACELVRGGWSQHADARSTDGQPAQPWHETAVAWSLLGALVAALEVRGGGRDLPLDDLAAALDELAVFVDDDSLADWNDAPSRTQHDVVSALASAAHAAGSKP